MIEVVYIIKNANRNHYKIGVSDDVERRLIQLQTGNSERLFILHVIESSDAYGLEAILHNTFRAKNLIGEWFELNERDIEIILEFRDKGIIDSPFKKYIKNPVIKKKQRKVTKKFKFRLKIFFNKKYKK